MPQAPVGRIRMDALWRHDATTGSEGPTGGAPCAPLFQRPRLPDAKEVVPFLGGPRQRLMRNILPQSLCCLRLPPGTHFNGIVCNHHASTPLDWHRVYPAIVAALVAVARLLGVTLS